MRLFVCRIFHYIIILEVFLYACSDSDGGNTAVSVVCVCVCTYKIQLTHTICKT